MSVNKLSKGHNCSFEIKFDHFLPELLNNRALLLNKNDSKHFDNLLT